jgi:hypothetical protein
MELPEIVQRSWRRWLYCCRMPTQTWAADLSAIWDPNAATGLFIGFSALDALLNGHGLWSFAYGAGVTVFVMACAMLGRWRGAL